MRENRKVSADFHVDLNHEIVRKMLSGLGNPGSQGTPGGHGGVQENGLKSPTEKRSGDCQLSQELEDWLCFPKQVSESFKCKSVTENNTHAHTGNSLEVYL